MIRIHLLFILLLLYPFSSYAYSHLSPYSYSGGDPVNCVDPTGCVIEGVTKKDKPGDPMSFSACRVACSHIHKLTTHIHKTKNKINI